MLSTKPFNGDSKRLCFSIVAALPKRSFNFEVPAGKKGVYRVLLAGSRDHVATLRQARRTHDPDPVWAASLCELAGADGITVHLREDRRHIHDRDLLLLRQLVRVKLNLEMGATDEMITPTSALE